MNSISGKIGFIGIGAMGTPMAGNLAKAGYKLVVYDADPKRALALAATHEIEIAESLAALGAGHAIKALNNYVSAAGLVAVCEAVIVGRSFGLEPGILVDILNASSGMNNTTKNKVKQYMISGAFNAGFTMGLMAKDVRTALEVAEAMHGPTRMARHTSAVWSDAEQQLGAAADHTAMFRYLETLQR